MSSGKKGTTEHYLYGKGGGEGGEGGVEGGRRDGLGKREIVKIGSVVGRD